MTALAQYIKLTSLLILEHSKTVQKRAVKNIMASTLCTMYVKCTGSGWVAHPSGQVQTMLVPSQVAEKLTSSHIEPARDIWLYGPNISRNSDVPIPDLVIPLITQLTFCALVGCSKMDDGDHDLENSCCMNKVASTKGELGSWLHLIDKDAIYGTTDPCKSTTPKKSALLCTLLWDVMRIINLGMASEDFGSEGRMVKYNSL